jgi:hypothetical protein
MAPARRPPLDELMIVNPGTPMTIRALSLRTARPHVEPEQPERRSVSGHGHPGQGRFFLGSDGTLYEVIE